jgi:peptidoglycan/xylan/chitin deacetylase (PgdA/CDA1 family)
VSKKVYKKNKKVVEIIIYRRKPQQKKINIAELFSLAGIFFVAPILYYLSLLFIFNNVQLDTVQLYKAPKADLTSSSNDYYANQVPVNVQSIILHNKGEFAHHTKHDVASKNDNSIQSDQIIWHGPRNVKEVALTFDADMTPVMVDWLQSGQVSTYDDTRITNYLSQNQIKATFFLTGLWIQSYPDATKELADNPLFELENHSYSHPSMFGYCFDQPQIPQSQYPYEIEMTQKLIEQYTHQAPKYFRFPGGCYDQSDLDLVRKEGLVTVHWDAVADDGFNADTDQIVQNVLNETQNGSIIVLHLGGQSNTPATAQALPEIVNNLKKDGYQFVTVSELLNPPKIVARINPKEYLASLKSFQLLSE